MFKGLRTVIVGLGLAIAPVALQYLSGVDWSQYVSPTTAFLISGLVMTAMRFFTTTPIGKSKE